MGYQGNYMDIPIKSSEIEGDFTFHNSKLWGTLYVPDDLAIEEDKL